MQVDLDGFTLPIKKLKGTDPVETLDFSHKRLGPASAVVIGSLIRDNASLTKLNVMGNMLGADGKAALQDAVRNKEGFRLHM